MKFIFLFLLMANVGLAGYFLLSPDQVAVANPEGEQIEAPTVLLVDEVKEAQVQPKIIEQVEQKPLCTRLGPFIKRSASNIVVKQLELLDVDAGVEIEDTKISSAFQVVIPPLGSRTEARSLFEDLKSKSIDSFVIRDGALENGISLGMYTRIESAEARKKDMDVKGYASEIVPVLKDAKQYWLHISPADAEKITQDQWAKILKANATIKKQENECKTLALLDDIQ